MNNEDVLFSQFAAAAVVRSLIEEVELTPKPGLVDCHNPGSHRDLTIQLMKTSAESLTETFEEIARVSFGRKPSQSLREEIAYIGRIGEKRMFEATGGINTHKGAIWALGLLISASAMGKGRYSILEILSKAGETACFPDRHYHSIIATNGSRVRGKYGVTGARGEAQQGFPQIRKVALPMLSQARAMGFGEEKAQLITLLSLIAHVNDTCILHRGGAQALSFAKRQAATWLKNKDFSMLKKIDKEFTSRNISPGGSADLLAATIFLEKTQGEKADVSIKKEFEWFR